MLKAGLAIGTMQVASPFLVKALGEEPIKMGLDDPFIHRLSIMSNVELCVPEPLLFVKLPA